MPATCCQPLASWLCRRPSNENNQQSLPRNNVACVELNMFIACTGICTNAYYYSVKTRIRRTK